MPGKATQVYASTPGPRKKRKRKLSDHVKFNQLSPPKKGSKSSKSLSPGEPRERKVKVSEALSKASAGLSGRGTAGRILKSALAGASAGAGLEESFRSFKKERATAKARKASITVDQATMAAKDRKKREKK